MNKFPIKNQKLAQQGLGSLSDRTRLRSGYILITGSTGLVGQYLLNDLFAREQKLAVLVRRNKKASAVQRIEDIMHRWEQQLERNLPRPIVLEGDVSNEQLNMSPDDRNWARQHCDRIIHNAAILQFHGASRAGEPWQTNLEGTRNVLDFSRNADIQEFHYVSTAYVSGLCETSFSESDFDIGQEFRNDYERSKFGAEKLVRLADGFDSKTIYRPAVIVGDSKTGFTASYHGLYLYLRLMAKLIPEQEPDCDGIRRTPIRLPMQGDEPRNLVSVDYVSEVISEIVCNPTAHNQTFHLVPELGLTARQLINYCYEYFNSTGAQFCDSSDETKNKNDFAAKYLENVKVYSSYDTSDPVFESENVRRFCAGTVCPAVDKQVVFKLLDFGIQDNWGKSRKTSVDATSWIETHLQDLQAAFKRWNESDEIANIQFGLDILGPGGGQWQFSVNHVGEVLCRTGISNGTTNVWSIDQNDFNATGIVREILTRIAKNGNSSEKPLQTSI